MLNLLCYPVFGLRRCAVVMEPARSFRFDEHPQWLEPWVTHQLAPRLKQTPSNDRVTTGNGQRLHARYGQNDPEIALGRNYLFAGSDVGGDRAAAMYTIMQTAKLNEVNPELYLKDTLCKIANAHPISRIDELMPWWTAPSSSSQEM
jgi:hypothetical protein